MLLKLFIKELKLSTKVAHSSTMEGFISAAVQGSLSNPDFE